jgi:uncharacterized membrane protein
MRCGSPVAAGGPPQAPQQPQQPPQAPGGWQPQQPPPQQPQYGQQPPQYGQQPPQYGQQPPQYGQQPPQYGQQPPQYGQPPASTGGLDENLASALCYALGLITGILFLVLEPHNKNKTIRFHAFQSIFFSLGVIVLNIALRIVFSVLFSILPYSMWALFGMLSLLLSLCYIAAWVFLMYKAYNRERFKIPIIGDLAEKQA